MSQTKADELTAMGVKVHGWGGVYLDDLVHLVLLGRARDPEVVRVAVVQQRLPARAQKKGNNIPDKCFL